MKELTIKNQENTYQNNKFDQTNQTYSYYVSQNKRFYGNMKILFRNRKLFLIVGPDYRCFIAAFITFLVLQVLTAKIVYNQLGNSIIFYLFIGGAILQQSLYLVVGLSDPEQIQNYGQLRYIKICKICNIRMKPKTKHCHQCNVCIRGYDHHCPWTSKCVGQKNLTKFYYFAIFSFIYFVLCFVILSMLIRQ